jgi:hypothetical protein
MRLAVVAAAAADAAAVFVAAVYAVDAVLAAAVLAAAVSAAVIRLAALLASVMRLAAVPATVMRLAAELAAADFHDNPTCVLDFFFFLCDLHFNLISFYFFFFGRGACLIKVAKINKIIASANHIFI